MARTFHRIHERARTGSNNQIKAAELWLEGRPWTYVVGGILTCACCAGGWWLLGDAPRLHNVLAGALFIAGGGMEIFLARPLARLRDSIPWWVRVAEGGSTGMIDYGPNTYRFFGSAAAGLGFGAINWALMRSMAVAIAVGIAACLAMWVWTWFAFPSIEDE